MGPNQSSSLAIVTIFLLCLSTVIILLRFWVRFSIKYFGLDDWLMLFGYILFIGTCIAVIIGSNNGFGTLDINLTKEQMIIGQKCLLVGQVTYCLASVCIKSGICVTLVRLSNTRVVTYPAYAVITISVLAGIATFVILLSICKPIKAQWEPSAGKCASTSVTINASYFISATYILTDFSCVVLPIGLLWNLHLSWKIKAPVVCILSFGALASAATIVRIIYFRNYSNKTNYLHGVANISLWTVIELGVGLSAGSAPALRPLLRLISSGSWTDSRPSRYQPFRRRRESSHFISTDTATRDA
ncbi:hypothetical protein EDB81DRAFT_674596 [Dactylonectria macrodidyma]|uniref:Rhodopsin domain-containing protein n=1 Tax=Dactylonectria macrodidyma TaxID=307937 RepID=A0A9P9FU46_9HYPO|nr:hypothetical protein EDB81DRAFT_674596 [Dactylonectria macrodidyma]